MHDHSLKVSPQEAKAIFVRSFYSIHRNALAFCENNQILFPSQQIIETYCCLMTVLLNDHFTPEEAEHHIAATETQIYEAAIKGNQLAAVLKKSEKAYKKESHNPIYTNKNGKIIKKHEKLPANLAPHVRKEILDKMDLHRLLPEPNAMLAEHIIMTYWDAQETLENIIISTYGESKSSPTLQPQNDNLSWFLSQQLPLVIIEAAQKVGGSKEHFLQAFQQALSDWLGWLIGFHSAIDHKALNQQIREKVHFLKQSFQDHPATHLVD